MPTGTIQTSVDLVSTHTSQNQAIKRDTYTETCTGKNACVRVVRVRRERHTHAPYLIRACVCVSLVEKKRWSWARHHAVAGP